MPLPGANSEASPHKDNLLALPRKGSYQEIAAAQEIERPRAYTTLVETDALSRKSIKVMI